MFPEEIKSYDEFTSVFHNEQACLQYLEERRWNGNVTSPFVENGEAWKCKNGKYICKTTKKYFTVKNGSIFERSRIPLRKWFIAIWLITDFKKGVSSKQLARILNLKQPTAWAMALKIRKLFNIDIEKQYGGKTIEKLEGIIESDESFIGGKNKNRHKDKKVPMSQGRSFKDKTPVLGLLQRNGKLRAFVVPDTKAKTLQPIIRKHVKKGSVFISDEWSAYTGLDSDFDHHVVDHKKKQYVSYDNPEIHSNSIEGFWGILKRGYNGIYNWWSRKYMQLYVDEFVYRFNTRVLKPFERFSLILPNVFVRVTHKQLKSLIWN